MISPEMHLKAALSQAISEAEAYQKKHAAWFAKHSGRWTYNTDGHRRSAARFQAKMESVTAAVEAMRNATAKI